MGHLRDTGTPKPAVNMAEAGLSFKRMHIIDNVDSMIPLLIGYDFISAKYNTQEQARITATTDDEDEDENKAQSGPQEILIEFPLDRDLGIKYDFGSPITELNIKKDSKRKKKRRKKKQRLMTEIDENIKDSRMKPRITGNDDDDDEDDDEEETDSSDDDDDDDDDDDEDDEQETESSDDDDDDDGEDDEDNKSASDIEIVPNKDKDKDSESENDEDGRMVDIEDKNKKKKKNKELEELLSRKRQNAHRQSEQSMYRSELGPLNQGNRGKRIVIDSGIRKALEDFEFYDVFEAFALIIVYVKNKDIRLHIKCWIGKIKKQRCDFVSTGIYKFAVGTKDHFDIIHGPLPWCKRHHRRARMFDYKGAEDKLYLGRGDVLVWSGGHYRYEFYTLVPFKESQCDTNVRKYGKKKYNIDPILMRV